MLIPNPEMEGYSTLFTIIHPVQIGSNSEESLALFDYIIHEDETNGEINISECQDVQLLPSEKKMEKYEGLGLFNQLRPDSSSLYLRNEPPFPICSEDDLVVLRKNLTDRIFSLLQYSLPCPDENF